MKILVIGATSFIGKTIVKELKGQGHEVTALVRKTSKIDDLKTENIPVAYGDINDPESLKRGLPGPAGGGSYGKKLLDVTIVHPPWVYGEGDGLSFPKWSKVSRAAIWSFSETVVAILLKLTMSGILPRRWNNIIYDTSKLKALGFKQGYTFEEGITG